MINYFGYFHEKFEPQQLQKVVPFKGILEVIFAVQCRLLHQHRNEYYYSTHTTCTQTLHLCLHTVFGVWVLIWCVEWRSNEDKELCDSRREGIIWMHCCLQVTCQTRNRLPLYQDCWTNEGQAYFKDLCHEIEVIRNSKNFGWLWRFIGQHMWKSITRLSMPALKKRTME